MSLPDQAVEQAVVRRRPSRSPVRDAAWGCLIGILAGLLGLGPWLVTGAHLPVQNMWGAEGVPDQMPVALLPLSQYQLTTLVALLTVGGAAAGLTVRLCPPVRRWLVVWCAAAGVLVVQVAAAVQSFRVLDAGLKDGTMSSLYFAGLLAGVTVSIAAALVALLLLSSRGRSLVALGAGLMAVPFASWAVLWVAGFVGRTNVPLVVPTIAQWVPAILVGWPWPGAVFALRGGPGYGPWTLPCCGWFPPSSPPSTTSWGRAYWPATCRRCC